VPEGLDVGVGVKEVQVALPGALTVPPGHGLHSTAPPVALLEKKLGGHWLQVAAPGVLLLVPGGQGVGVVEERRQKEPGGQRMGIPEGQ
jgi:hypothetical protein